MSREMVVGLEEFIKWIVGFGKENGNPASELKEVRIRVQDLLANDMTADEIIIGIEVSLASGAIPENQNLGLRSALEDTFLALCETVSKKNDIKIAIAGKVDLVNELAVTKLQLAGYHVIRLSGKRVSPVDYVSRLIDIKSHALFIYSDDFVISASSRAEDETPKEEGMESLGEMLQILKQHSKDIKVFVVSDLSHYDFPFAGVIQDPLGVVQSIESCSVI